MQQVLSSGFPSARTDILSRFVKFFQGLLVAPSHEVRTVALLVARDIRTTTGKNLDLIRQEANMDPWTVKSHAVKKKLTQSETVDVREEDKWRVKYLAKLLEQRQELYYGGYDHTDNLIKSVCIN